MESRVHDLQLDSLLSHAVFVPLCVALFVERANVSHKTVYLPDCIYYNMFGSFI